MRQSLKARLIIVNAKLIFCLVLSSMCLILQAVHAAGPIIIDHACTDITGFGIAGHAFEMAVGSNVQVTLDFKELPLYPDALKMYKKGETTKSNRANRKMSEGALEITTKLKKEEEEILFDPQTSGGLLIAVPANQVQKMLKRLKRSHREGIAVVGKIEAADTPKIKII